MFNLKNVQHTRNLGTSKNLFHNLLRDIEKATEGKISWPPPLMEKLQVAHDKLQAYENKRTSQGQVMDAMASAGLIFHNWILSTHNKVQIDGVNGAKDDPLGSLAGAADDKPAEEVLETFLGSLEGKVADMPAMQPAALLREVLREAYTKLYLQRVYMEDNPEESNSTEGLESIYARIDAVVAKLQGQDVVVPESAPAKEALRVVEVIEARQQKFVELGQKISESINTELKEITKNTTPVGQVFGKKKKNVTE